MMRTAMTSATITETLIPASADSAVTTHDLLLALDTCNRSDSMLIRNTIHELITISQESGEDAVTLVKLVLVTVFKRRNHNKSQADGEGAGEILIFLSTLQAIIELGNEFEGLVVSILPLVHVYGSWKDLRVLAEKMVEQQLIQAGQDAQSVELNKVCKLICRIFAEQMVKDQANAETATPSNACKYVPHYTRHFHRKTAAGKRKRHEGGEGPSGREAEGPGRGGHVGRAAVDASESEAEPAGTSPDDEAVRSVANIANRLLADEICRIACPAEYANKRGKAAYRKLRAGLNRVLVKKGHLVEPLLCAKEIVKINFARANKKSLTVYTKAIKRAGLSSRWMAAMKNNASAVPDLDQIPTAVADYLREEAAPEGEVLKMFDMRLAKAIKSVQASREKIVSSAKEVQEARLLAGGEADLQAAEAKVGVVVDTAGCMDSSDRMSLVLAAFILARAQGLNCIAVDGIVCSLTETSANEDGVDVTTDLDWHRLVPVQSAESLDSSARFQSGTSALLRALREDAVAGDSEVCDLIFMCYEFAAYDADKEAVHSHIASLQATVPAAAADGEGSNDRLTLRSIRVHRMRPSVSGSDDYEGGVLYEPRRGLRALPADASQITADLAFVVDFTGSMGTYMSAVKTQLVSVINAIQNSVRCKNIRVALVGYRDYKDTGRVVVQDFQDRANLQELLNAIAGQEASGGGDSPEDLLSGLVAVNNLGWSSDIRLQVIITDANAHGYHTDSAGDYYPSGKCPDQAADADYPSLPQIMSTLADGKQVDTFFCQLNDYTLKTLNAVASAYTDGQRGFGTVSIGRSATDFKDKIIACVSSAIAGTISETKVCGLQTADGVTLSSLMSSLNASLRESLLEMGSSEPVALREAEAEAEVEGDDEMEIVDECAAADADADTAADTGMFGEVDGAAVVSGTAPSAPARDTKKVAPKPQSDYDRLMRELELQELTPVRIALRLPVWASATLSNKAAEALFKAGLTAEQLVEGSYPEPIIASYELFLQGALARV